MDDFFRASSKIVIVIPIVTIIIGLIIKFNQKTENLNTIKTSSDIDFITPKTVTPTIMKKNEEKINFNFNGPLVCRFKDKDYEVNAFIKNKKINLKVNSKGVVKEYDLSSYLPFIEMILNNNDSQGINSLIKMYTGKDIDIKKLVESCEKRDF